MRKDFEHISNSVIYDKLFFLKSTHYCWYLASLPDQANFAGKSLSDSDSASETPAPRFLKKGIPAGHRILALEFFSGM